MTQRDASIQVIAPNLKRRLSGVTTTVLRLIPVQARHIDIRATGPGLTQGIPHISLWRVMFLPRDTWRVWHARRNNEMILGLLLRSVFRRKFKLLFTSAAQRDHKPFTKRLIAKMDALVATSPQAAGFLDHPATVVMHGIDTDVFHPAEDRLAIREELALPQGFLIGCFGRIRPQKGQDLLVEAALELLPSRPDIHIVFTGRATQKFEAYQADLEAKIAQAGLSDRVKFLGEIPWDDVVRLYQTLDVFTTPARWEGFGLTPIEAMACGTPAVACHEVGAFDTQIVEGETGHLIEKGSAPALIEALKRMMDDRVGTDKMRVAARAHVEQHFSIEREAQSLIEIYKRLLS
ncbi:MULTISPECIES: glycosyltransferase family 4 protein [Pacificibacter]|uniref:glycosyltransferase family 4 protein n=1 Tax=Pacificibacter TaxID=1042323 RepID=UPI001C09D97A|nr:MULTISPECIES: glycosyltransferase family 4 protein [Pacificibacter]MBU2937258.1 glycosyltransferase family 4 protein [Pacificibacter marinus]MDO6615253.1 glycosyltransferase family 4 protein [Pacificibacter sp. 1_MG-2023]